MELVASLTEHNMAAKHGRATRKISRRGTWLPIGASRYIVHVRMCVCVYVCVCGTSFVNKGVLCLKLGSHTHVQYIYSMHLFH